MWDSILGIWFGSFRVLLWRTHFETSINGSYFLFRIHLFPILQISDNKYLPNKYLFSQLLVLFCAFQFSEVGMPFNTRLLSLSLKTFWMNITYSNFIFIRGLGRNLLQNLFPLLEMCTSKLPWGSKIKNPN